MLEDPKLVLTPPGSRIRNLMFQSGWTSLANVPVRPSTANLLSGCKLSRLKV
jgi:hypothetical protein